MTTRVKNIVREIDRLPEMEQRELADEIFRRAQYWPSSPLTDDDLTDAATTPRCCDSTRETENEKSASE